MKRLTPNDFIVVPAKDHSFLIEQGSCKGCYFSPRSRCCVKKPYYKELADKLMVKFGDCAKGKIIFKRKK